MSRDGLEVEIPPISNGKKIKISPENCVIIPKNRVNCSKNAFFDN